MIRILFVCLGNICRSPMAECIFADLARKQGREQEFQVDSAATSREEEGNGMYPPAIRKLKQKDVPLRRHRARPMTRADYDRFDLLIGMERRNLTAMERIAGGDPQGKLRRLLDYTDAPGDVADPWYTDDFERAYQDILRGCQALLDSFPPRV